MLPPWHQRRDNQKGSMKDKYSRQPTTQVWYKIRRKNIALQSKSYRSAAYHAHRAKSCTRNQKHNLNLSKKKKHRPGVPSQETVRSKSSNDYDFSSAEKQKCYDKDLKLGFPLLYHVRGKPPFILPKIRSHDKAFILISFVKHHECFIVCTCISPLREDSDWTSHKNS